MQLRKKIHWLDGSIVQSVYNLCQSNAIFPWRVIWISRFLLRRTVTHFPIVIGLFANNPALVQFHYSQELLSHCVTKTKKKNKKKAAAAASKEGEPAAEAKA